MAGEPDLGGIFLAILTPYLSRDLDTPMIMISHDVVVVPYQHSSKYWWIFFLVFMIIVISIVGACCPDHSQL